MGRGSITSYSTYRGSRSHRRIKSYGEMPLADMSNVFGGWWFCRKLFVGSSNFFFFDGASGFFSPTHRGLALGHVLLTRVCGTIHSWSDIRFHGHQNSKQIRWDQGRFPVYLWIGETMLEKIRLYTGIILIIDDYLLDSLPCMQNSV